MVQITPDEMLKSMADYGVPSLTQEELGAFAADTVHFIQGPAELTNGGQDIAACQAYAQRVAPDAAEPAPPERLENFIKPEGLDFA